MPPPTTKIPPAGIRGIQEWWRALRWAGVGGLEQGGVSRGGRGRRVRAEEGIAVGRGRRVGAVWGGTRGVSGGGAAAAR